MKNGEPKRTGLFGGTFDPVHKGHVSAAASFINSNHIDSLWILLNPAPPHKKGAHFAPYGYRLKMLQEAFKDFKKVTVSDVETRLPKPCYTIQTILYLKNSCPGRPFFLCIGKDSFIDFKSWYKWQQILKICPLIVADRPSGENVKVDPALAAHATFVEHEPVAVSSSEIRKHISQGKSIEHLVAPSVSAFITENKLYR